jgi:hypothetical protein
MTAKWLPAGMNAGSVSTYNDVMRLVTPSALPETPEWLRRLEANEDFQEFLRTLRGTPPEFLNAMSVVKVFTNFAMAAVHFGALVDSARHVIEANSRERGKA